MKRSDVIIVLFAAIVVTICGCLLGCGLSLIFVGLIFGLVVVIGDKVIDRYWKRLEESRAKKIREGVKYQDYRLSFSFPVRMRLLLIGTTVVGMTLFSLYTVSVFGNSYYGGGSDDTSNEYYAYILTNTIGLGSFPGKEQIVRYITLQDHNSPGYIVLISWLFKAGFISGEYITFTPRLLNILLVNLMGSLTWHMILHERKNFRLASFGAISVSCAPIMIYNSSFVLRDIVIAFIYFIAYLALRQAKCNQVIGMEKIVCWITFGLCMYMMSGQRSLSLLLLAVAVPVWIISYSRLYIRASRLLKVLLGVLAIVLVMIPLVFAWNAQVISFEILERYLNSYSWVRMGYGNVTSFVYGAPLPGGLILRALFGWLSPLPGRELNILNVVFLFSVLFIVWNTRFVFRGLWLEIKRRDLLLPYFFLATYLPYALITGTGRNICYYWPFWVFLCIRGRSSDASMLASPVHV